jgi:putative sterol carrier protein
MTSDVAPIEFATQPWLDQFSKVLNTSPSFRKAASKWSDDSLFVVETDPAYGWTEPRAFYMKWNHGEIVHAVVTEEVNRAAVYRVTGTYSAWAHVYHNKMAAGIAFLTGKFKFRAPFVKAARNLHGQVLMLQTVYTIPTTFRGKESAHVH